MDLVEGRIDENLTRLRDKAFQRFWWDEDDGFNDVSDTTHADYAMGYLDDLNYDAEDYPDIEDEADANLWYMRQRDAVRGGVMPSPEGATVYLDGLSLGLVHKCLVALLKNHPNVVQVAVTAAKREDVLEGARLEFFIRRGQLPRETLREADMPTTLNEAAPGRFTKKAIFMAGSPGAGKSTIIGPIAKAFGFVNLDVDRLLVLAGNKAGLDVKQPSPDVHATRNRIFQSVADYQGNLLERGIPFIVNTTSADRRFVEKLKADIEAWGYECWMIFVDVDLETARTRAGARDYAVPDNEIVKRHRRVNAAIDHYRSIFSRVITIDNNGHLDRNDPQIVNLYRLLNAW